MKTLKIGSFIAVITIGFVTLLFTGCTRVEPGYVGIKVNQAGANKGVEQYPLQTGWVFYFPVTTRVYEYPIFQQSVIWCESITEGSPTDESISFNCKGGAAIKADISMSGKFNAERVAYVFVKFRAKPFEIIHGYLRNEVRDALGRVASKYDPMDIIGDRRGEFLDGVKKEVKIRIGDWWDLDYITFANKLRVDEKIESAISQIIAQKQQTAAAELKVQQSIAEANQKVASAEGEARSRIASADGEAKAILLKARAQAEANEMIAQSLARNSLVLQSIALEKWDGKLPYVNGGGALPFISITSTNY